MKAPDVFLEEFYQSISKMPDSIEKIDMILDFTITYGDSYNDKLYTILSNAIKICKKIDYKIGEALCFYFLIFFKGVVQGNYVEEFEAIIPPIEELNAVISKSDYWYSMSKSLNAYIHWFRGEYEKAFNEIFECIKQFKPGDSIWNGWVYFALGIFYFDTKDYENSLINYNKAYDLFNNTKKKDLYGMARARNGIGSNYIALSRYDEALNELSYSVDIYYKLNHFSGYSRAVNDLGMLAKSKKEYDKAIEYLQKSIEVREQIEHWQGLTTSLTELGECYLLINDLPQARDQFEKGLGIAFKISSVQKQVRLFQLLYETHKKLNETSKALFYFEKFYDAKTTLLSDETANNIKKIHSDYEKENAEKEAEIERLRNVELKKANEIIEQKNKDITDSINYAKRIQLGILPSTELLDKCFEDYFIFYQPKDIVSGDFYWAVNSINRVSGNKISVVAAIDCTGHGVPGAFMSVLGNTLLNQTITNPEVVSAADVLNYLNKYLPQNLKSSEKDQSIRDGMDMALCIFDWSTMSMEYAGANNPCWIMRNNELIEYKATKQAISASDDLVKIPFNNNLIELQKNDRIYLFTDGYADQFGGPREKKFTYKRMKELLLETQTCTMREQCEKLKNAINEWKGDIEQIDDICIIGIHIV